VIAQLKVVQRADVDSSTFDKAKWTTQLSPFLHLWKKLNTGCELVKLSPDSIPSPSSSDPPLLAFLLLERQTAVKLVQSVHADLSSLSRIIRGTTLLTTQAQRMASSLLLHELPQAWSSVWEGSSNPVQWLRGLIAKSIALGGWVDRCRNGTLLPGPADLSELFHPDVFLNALRQETARKTGTPINHLVFTCQWNGEVKGAVCPVKIEGLLVEGALFDGSRLIECQRDSPTSCAVPSCNVAWVPSATPPSDCVEVPIYYSTEREQIVSCINVPCTGSILQWKLKSVALILKNQ